MPKWIALIFLSAAALGVCAYDAGAITIATVPIGNAGNAADPLTGNGAVGYAYSMGTYDVTIGQYTAFLNAVAATDPYLLYIPAMGTDLTVAGIARSGSSGSYTYSVIGSTANNPITYVTFESAARFANWMDHGQPTGPEGPATTESGSYTMNGATTDAAIGNITRNADATWVIPTENEWYKAAYYQPTAHGGPASGYWFYPTQSNTAPTSHAPSGTPDTANVTSPTGAYAVTGSSTLNPNQDYLTAVGAYTHSASYYGTYDQSTDVGNWTENLIGAPDWRGDPGGAWNGNARESAADQFFGRPGSSAASDTGFRLALVVPTPEPSTAVLGLIACCTLWWWRKRFK